jgi:hypothetical protein
MDKGLPVNITHMTLATGTNEPHWYHRVGFSTMVPKLALFQLLEVNKPSGPEATFRHHRIPMLNDEPLWERPYGDAWPPTLWIIV